MADYVTITLSRASSSYTHNLSYEIGTKSGTIATGVATSHKWWIPKELVTEITNATSGKLTVICETKNGTATVGTKKVTATVIVPTASEPSPASMEATMGEKVRIFTGTKADQYTHTLEYTFGSKRGYIGEEKSVGTYIDWDVPISLAKEIPNETLHAVTIKCTTYNGSAKVGEASCPFVLSVPDNDITKPKFNMAFTPEHSLNDAFKDVFVQGKSKVNVTFEDKSEYSNIKSYAVVVEGVAKAGNPVVSETIMGSGEVAVTVSAVDSRGYNRTETEYITVLPYARPKLVPYGSESELVYKRSLSDGTIDHKGEYALIKASASYSRVDGLNKCRLKYRYKRASESEYPDIWTLLEGTEISSPLDVVFTHKIAYTIQINIEDDVGEERIYTFPINASRTPLHLGGERPDGEGGRNLGLGQFCDYSKTDAIDIGWTTYFNTGIGYKVIFEASDGSSGWGQGAILNDLFDDADTMVIMNYTLFLAFIKTGNSIIPALCIRVNDRVYDTSGAWRMYYSTEDQTLTLESAQENQSITALYALL
jgi:hypothetical protein